MTKYTAADFANARFAEHPDGQIAARFNTDPCWPWHHSGDEFKDEYMAKCGWVPVPTKPTLTDSEVGELVPINLPEEYLTGFIDGFEEAGGTIIPDPEPTNTDNLTELMKEIDQAIGLGVAPRTVAKYLNDNGVTAPNVKGN